MTRFARGKARSESTHKARKPFYITSRRGKCLASRENYASVTSSDDVASFESGSDLLLINGQLWKRPIYMLSKYWPPLYEKLREDQFIPDDLHKALSTLPLKNPNYYRNHFLYTLNDTFIVDFNRLRLSFLVITEQGLETMSIEKGFFYTNTSTRLRPFTGSALARFERSTLPEHKGTRTIVLRFLKIITPVKCVIPLDVHDDYMYYPKEGELHRRVSKYRTKKKLSSVECRY